ncbi:DUF2634 domain-containing protein [Gracilibacillus oryzae]|uniref:DUF2634 domain-containing protein n=1 Tax=Gracilibacillus oryzae TaxID=1672701 RepID=A0A7C8KWW6_9BACI|nr:DUF2634 domain-containing protein [Gracilibacillus oryzae]KAB8139258.1 DUF2634 domain-containing protein [Gracilibacillus oryzae]
MKALKINEDTGDIVMENGDFVWVEKEEELMQEIRSVLKTNLMEWFLDPLHGTRYEAFRQKAVDEEEATQVIYEALEQVARVTSVIEVNVSFDRRIRLLEIDFRCVADDEIIEGSEVMDVA